MTARMVLHELYETEFGIYDHIRNIERRPLASVAMFPSEDINDGSLLEESMKVYIEKKIWDLFHLNYFEFISLPRDVIEIMTTVANQEFKNKSQQLDELEKKLKE